MQEFSSESEQFVHFYPPVKLLHKFIQGETVEIMLWFEEKLREADTVFISCDKEHRKGEGHFPEILS